MLQPPLFLRRVKRTGGHYSLHHTVKLPGAPGLISGTVAYLLFIRLLVPQLPLSLSLNQYQLTSINVNQLRSIRTERDATKCSGVPVHITSAVAF